MKEVEGENCKNRANMALQARISHDFKFYKEKSVSFETDSGGRNRTRTCDPIDVNDVLYQLSHATISFIGSDMAEGDSLAESK